MGCEKSSVSVFITELVDCELVSKSEDAVLLVTAVIGAFEPVPNVADAGPGFLTGFFSSLVVGVAVVLLLPLPPAGVTSTSSFGIVAILVRNSFSSVCAITTISSPAL